MYASELTRQFLEEAGIVSVEKDDTAPFGWRIYRLWYPRGSRWHKPIQKRIIELKIQLNTQKHPYGKDKSYVIVCFCYKNKIHSYTLSRFLYAWFFGKVDKGYCVDHEVNDPFWNDLVNLSAKTTAENNQKRFNDNLHHTCFNQFYNTVKNGKNKENKSCQKKKK